MCILSLPGRSKTWNSFSCMTKGIGSMPFHIFGSSSRSHTVLSYHLRDYIISPLSGQPSSSFQKMFKHDSPKQKEDADGGDDDGDCDVVVVDDDDDNNQRIE